MPKRAAAKRVANKTAAANEALSGATTSCGREVVIKWMDDHQDRVPELALFLMQGGFDGKKTTKCPGFMSRGTSTLTDLPKKWLHDLLMQLCPDLPAQMMQAIYQHHPALLMRIFHISQNITADPDGRPRKVTDYYPRNYLGLAHTAQLRHEAYGNRLLRIAEYLRTLPFDSRTGVMERKRMLSDVDLNKCGVFSLLSPDSSGTDSWMLVHPSGMKVPVPERMGIDGNASFRENHDETQAMLANGEGVSSHIMPWLRSQQHAIPTNTTDFIALGWQAAKTQGALEDVAEDGEAEGAGALSPASQALSQSPPSAQRPLLALPAPTPAQSPQPEQQALASPPALLALTDTAVTTPQPKRPRPGASPVGLGARSSGVLNLWVSARPLHSG